ncbi:hypothetical protein Ari01nite_98530 [Paractinoplanes rishiriensis]|uniref:Uncharacterized protein n=1 Tax=Paractinoplanes rishiriensis TaxID=1050105 RepID=A0A919K9B1_9ACTN|nr:hypothetical protein Ari01nite_98530 [Actinoplanes rishiriensis]
MCTLVIRAWPVEMSTVRVVLFPLSSSGVMVMVYESMLSLKVVMPHPPTRRVAFRKGCPYPAPTVQLKIANVSRAARPQTNQHHENGTYVQTGVSHRPP